MLFSATGDCEGTDLNCTNRGFPDYSSGCTKCQCPEGFGGTLCDTLQESSEGKTEQLSLLHKET